MNLILGGVSRSGKTTLARNICKKYDFQYIPFDSIISTLEKLYSEIGMKHSDYNLDFSPKLAEFIDEFLSHVNYEGINTVLDLYQLFPSDLIQFSHKRNIIAFYLGYPDTSPQQKLADINQYARDFDWTNNMAEDNMLDIISLWIKESRIMEEQCRQFDIPFINTGEDFLEKINSAQQMIESELVQMEYIHQTSGNTHHG